MDIRFQIILWFIINMLLDHLSNWLMRRANKEIILLPVIFFILKTVYILSVIYNLLYYGET